MISETIGKPSILGFKEVAAMITYETAKIIIFEFFRQSLNASQLHPYAPFRRYYGTVYHTKNG